MKARTGFVSNSSSTSFIVDGNCYKSVFEVAQKMLPFREWDNDCELIDAIEQASKRMNPDTPICFNSCNYPTYIARDDNGNFAVQTCNNHQWDIEGKKYSMESEHFDDDYGEVRISEKLWFWYPEFNIFGREPVDRPYPGYCQYHFSDLVEMQGLSKSICPRCHVENKDNEKIETHSAHRCTCGGYMISMLHSSAISKPVQDIIWCSKCGRIRKIETYPTQPDKGSWSKIITDWPLHEKKDQET